MSIRLLDRLFSLLTIILGVYILFEAIGYGYWVRNAPGPGFFPLIASIGMIVLGAINLLRSMKGKEIIENELDLKSVVKSLVIVAIIVGFLLAAPYLGMLIGSAIMIFLIGLVIEDDKTARFIVKLGTISCLFPFVAYFLFSRYLQVPLIEGVWGL
ncbi:tripartite tricarboxylate transporter TctB family protein [Salinicola peritrichatus]|uniref:tripartite tricarboxylate transporter TctB family protein n=1 Tax=Salinicola peritrichatus TaxID=1267424 RepID=UPI0013A63B06|nr:tripartite tricarboxylate transporter TctB family protein [Salinicola peritrichatus]